MHGLVSQTSELSIYLCTIPDVQQQQITVYLTQISNSVCADRFSAQIPRIVKMDYVCTKMYPRMQLPSFETEND